MKAVNDARSAKYLLNESCQHKTLEAVAKRKGMHLGPD